MASEAGTQLTRQHRRRQHALRVMVNGEIVNLWGSTFDENDIARSLQALTRAASPIVVDAYRESTSEAVRFFTTFREIEGAPGRYRPRRAPVPKVADLRYSLEYASKITTLKAIKAGHAPTEAARRGLVRTMGDSARLATDGGRQTVARGALEDPDSSGWERITSGDPCEFCALIAARGPVYTSQQSADFSAHTHCDCEPAAVYGDWQPSEQVRRWQELYESEAKSAREPLKAFRDAYRAQRT